MRFDYTNGMNPKYSVIACGFCWYDIYYFHYFKEADKLFKSICVGDNQAVKSVSLYDMVNDKRKKYQRVR